MRNWRPDYNRYDQEWRVYETEDGMECPVINSLFKPRGEDGKKTAFLIAAAPAMFDALELIEASLSNGRPKDPARQRRAMLDLAKKAIAKAIPHES